MNIKVNEEDWEEAFVNIFSVTNSTKLRMFQYKILNGILTTNVVRSKYTANLTPKCTFCKTENETVHHLLVECRNVKNQWKNLRKWCKYILGITFELTDRDIILNNFNGKSKAFVNTLILLMKRYLYVTKCAEIPPVFTGFLAMLNDIYKLESLTAAQSNKLKTHYRKWKEFINY